MRDELRGRRRKQIECGILNLNTSAQPGSHWVAYFVKNSKAVYFDSFGNLPPPPELIKYLGKTTLIAYNHKQIQPFNSVICGHLCIVFILMLNAE